MHADATRVQVRHMHDINEQVAGEEVLDMAISIDRGLASLHLVDLNQRHASIRMDQCLQRYSVGRVATGYRLSASIALDRLIAHHSHGVKLQDGNNTVDYITRSMRFRYANSTSFTPTQPAPGVLNSRRV